MRKLLLLFVVPAIFMAGCKDDDDKTVNPPSKAEVETVSDMQAALSQGVPEVTLTKALTQNTTLTLPKAYAGDATVKITVPAGGKNLTINQENAGLNNLPSALELNINSAGDLTIGTPDMSVSFNGTVTNLLTASTADETLTIEKDAVVNKLTVLKGGVKILGTVNEIVDVEAGARVYFTASNAAELTAQLSRTPVNNSGVILTADISFETDYTSGDENQQDVFHIGAYRATEDYYKPSPFDGYVLDGNGFTISGVAYNNVLNVLANDVVIKNLTVTQTDAQRAKRANNGITVYRSKNVILQNVTVNNCGRAAVIVDAASVTADGLNTDGNNAWGGVNLSKGVSPVGGETPAFTLNGGDIKEAYSVYVDLDQTGSDYSVTVPKGWKITYMPEKNQRVYSRFFIEGGTQEGEVQ